MHVNDAKLSEIEEPQAILSDVVPAGRRFASLIEELRHGQCDEEHELEGVSSGVSPNPSVLQGPLSALGVGIIAVDAAGHVRWGSRLVQELTGWSESQLLGMPLERIFHTEEHRPGEGEALNERDVPSKAEPGSATGTLLSPSGIARSVRHTLAPLRDATGWVTSVLILFQDVTEVRLNTLRLEHYATHDASTGLLNRHSFMHSLSRAFAQSKLLALLYLD